jgi:uncharacterized protein (DUF2236 family)
MKCALATIAGFVASLLLASTANACGYCIEDRMAAVYDHAVMTRASAAGHKVAFYAVLGVAPTDGASAQAIRRAVESVRGVDKNSVRYSGDLAALSLSFDPRAAAWADIDRRIGKALAPRGLTLGLINIVDRPDEIRAGRATAAAVR